MPTKPKEVKCRKCGQASLSKSKSFFGFPKMTCPKCGQENEYPLGKGFRTFYAILIILGIILFFVAIKEGDTFRPGILLIIAVIMMFKDDSMRKIIRRKELDAQNLVNDEKSKEKEQEIFDKYCHQCGAELHIGQQFCKYCGTKQN